MNQFQFSRRILQSMATIACVTFLATPAAAQNLITNGDFATDISNWAFTTPGTFTFDGGPVFDADSNPASGSGRVQNQSPVAFGTSFAAQCINSITGGTNYDFGAKIYFDSTTQTATGRGNIVVGFFDGASCSGSNVGAFTTANVLSSTTNTWVAAEVLAVTAPVTAQSVQVNLFTNKIEDTGTLDVHFDNVHFAATTVPSGAGAVPDGANVPGTPLTVTHSAGSDIMLSWDPSCAGDTDYEIHEGTIGSYYSHNSLFCSTGGATTMTFTPSAGGTYYLVVPTNGVDDGSYGLDSVGSQRPPAGKACLPQTIVVCP